MSFTDDIRRIHDATFGVHGTADTRVIGVPPVVLPMIRQAKLSVPPPGEQYKVAELDAALSTGGLSVEQRITVKNVLKSVGLLGKR
jgi:hypothetical protein